MLYPYLETNSNVKTPVSSSAAQMQSLTPQDQAPVGDWHQMPCRDAPGLARRSRAEAASRVPPVSVTREGANSTRQRVTGSARETPMRPITTSCDRVSRAISESSTPGRSIHDITLARQLLKWEPKVPLEEGLKRTVAYFRGML